jgi:hypothetical protein
MPSCNNREDNPLFKIETASVVELEAVKDCHATGSSVVCAIREREVNYDRQEVLSSGTYYGNPVGGTCVHICPG